MDIFDEVIAYLKESKDRGNSTLYLTPESRAVLDRWATSGPADLASPHTPEVQNRSPKVAAPVPMPAAAPAPMPVQPAVVQPVAVQPVVVQPAPVSHLPQIVCAGNPQADLMFIGEEMWHSENQPPFSGKCGELLSKMTVAMKLSDAVVYRCSILKDYSITLEQAIPCLDLLSQQIRAVQPKVIVIMGALPLRLLTNTTGRLQQVRGNWLQFEGVPCMPTYHPEFLERCPNKKGEAWDDLKQVMGFLKLSV